MAKKITHDDIAEKNLLAPLVKEFDNVIKKTLEATDVVRELNKELSNKATIESAKDLERLAEITKRITKVEEKLIDIEKEKTKIQTKAIALLKKRREESEELTKTQKQRLKLEKDLKQANSDSIQDNEEIKIQLQEQRKINKKIAKDKLGLIDAYDKESETLNRLRKKYKNLAVQNKENTKEGKDLLKNITRLDKKLKEVDETVGQNQRSVGKYSKAFEGLNKTIGKLGLIALVVKGFELLSGVFADSREGALSLKIAFSKFTETAKVFVNSVINSFSGVKDFFVAIGDSFSLVGKKIERTFLEILDVTPFARDVTQDLKAINNEIKELEKSSVSDAIDKITGAFEGNVSATSKAIDAQEDYLKLQLKTRISIEQQEKALAGLAEKRQILQDISDDDTIGFITRAKAVKKAQEAAVEFANLENELALTKEKLTIDAVKQDLRRSKSLTDSALAQIKTGEQLKKILEDSSIARKVSDTNDEAFTAAFVERREKEVEAQSFARDQEEKNRKTARDDFEQELDILEEFTEKRVASNEKIINSDSASLKERQKALTENRKIENELLDASIDLIIKQGKASIDLRKDLTEAEKEQQKALLNTESIQEIINEKDSQEMFNLIRKLDLGEIEEKRLKETLKIKQDISQVNQESIKAEQEAIAKTKELKDDILLQERLLSGELVDIENEKYSNEKNNLRERIDLLKEDSIERLELQKELNDLLIGEEKDKNKKIADADSKAADKKAKEEEERKERRKELANQAVDETISRIDEQNDAKTQLIDDDISRLQDSIAIQQRIANEGGENILAEEKARLAKRNLERKRELKRQAQQEQAIALALAFVNSFAAYSKDEPKGALRKALVDTFLAKGVASLITGSFYDGVEDTGTVSNPLDSKGGRLTMTHDHERILSSAQNSMIPKGMTNDELAKMAYDYHNGNTWGFMPQISGAGDNTPLVKAIENNAKTIERSLKKYQSHQESELDTMGNFVIYTMRKGIKTIRNVTSPKL